MYRHRLGICLFSLKKVECALLRVPQKRNGEQYTPYLPKSAVRAKTVEKLRHSENTLSFFSILSA